MTLARQQEDSPARRLLRALTESFAQPDLRRRILFTFGVLVVYRLIAHVPVPGVDLAALQRLIESNQFLGILDLFSGGTLRNLSVAAMGLYPYITSSIIMQLLVPVFPRLQALAKEGEAGRQRINQITHWITVPLAAAQGYGQLVLLSRAGIVRNVGLTGDNLLPTITMVVSMTAATIFLTWLGELVTERGIGNGISMLIFAGIVAGLPAMIRQSFLAGGVTTGIIFFVGLGFLVVLLIVFFTEAQRRVPVQYGKSLFRGGRMYRQSGSSFIPLRVNSAGMIPIIFAISILIFPGIVASYFLVGNPGWVTTIARTVQRLFDPNGLFYWAIYFLLVVFFTFFYTLVIFQQQNLAENLQKNGGFIPGIRPGKPTEEYLNRVILRITWGGALFLGFVAVVPFVAQLVTGVAALQFSSTALLIVVGVVLDTMRQLEGHLLMRQYEGFIR